MNNGEVPRLEAELEFGKQKLREDTQRIRQKFAETRAQLSPTAVAERQLMPLLALGFILGFALGYRGISAIEIGSPAARAILATAGKDVAMRAIRGK
jgi:hypothetical protein